jgi:hypothetical protein
VTFFFYFCQGRIKKKKQMVLDKGTAAQARYLKLLKLGEKSRRLKEFVNNYGDREEFFFKKNELWDTIEFTDETFGGEYLPKPLEGIYRKYEELKDELIKNNGKVVKKKKRTKSKSQSIKFSYKKLVGLDTDRKLNNAITNGLTANDFYFTRKHVPDGVEFSNEHPAQDGKGVPLTLVPVLKNFVELEERTETDEDAEDPARRKPSKEPKAPLIQHGETYREFSKRVRTDVRNAINDKPEYEQMDKPSRSLFVTMAVKYHFKKGIQLTNKWPNSNTLKKIYDQMQESEAKRRDQAITLLREYGVENVEAAANHLMANCSKSCAFKRLTDKLKKLLPDYHKDAKWVRAVAPKKPKTVSKKAQKVSKESQKVSKKAQKVSSGVRSLVADLHLLKQGKAKTPKAPNPVENKESPKPAMVQNPVKGPKAQKHKLVERKDVEAPKPKNKESPKHVDPEPDDAPIYNLDKSFKVTDNTIQDLINECVKQWQKVSSNIQNDYNQLRRCGEALAKEESSSEVVAQVIDLIQRRLNVEDNIMNFANGVAVDDDEIDFDFLSTLEEDLEEPKRSYEIIKYQISQFEPEKWRKSRLAALERG